MKRTAAYWTAEEQEEHLKKFGCILPPPQKRQITDERLVMRLFYWGIFITAMVGLGCGPIAAILTGGLGMICLLMMIGLLILTKGNTR
jgi:hypothetical protein